jgi:hypothetical protein
VPARQMDIPRVWVDRDNTGEDAAAASMRVVSAVEVHAAVVHLQSGNG